MPVDWQPESAKTVRAIKEIDFKRVKNEGRINSFLINDFGNQAKRPLSRFLVSLDPILLSIKSIIYIDIIHYTNIEIVPRMDSVVTVFHESLS